MRMSASIFHRSLRPRSNQAGVGLIEVLVAVLVLSIAFLGVAALQAMSLSTNNTAMARSMATIDSYSILDAMRIDRAAAESGTYTTTVKAGGCAATTSGSTLASVQLSQWCKQLGGNLGASNTTTGKIDCSGTGDCTITVTFDITRSAVDQSSTQTVVTRAML